MPPRLLTRRLRLDPVTHEHLPLLVALNSDPAVMAYVENGRPATAEETAAEWERRLVRQSDPARGLGYWAGSEDLLDPDRGRVFVGWWSAASYADDPAQVGVGYRLTRVSWGRGLASEGGLRMVEHAFSVAGVERVVASTMAINTGSRRVLEKIGMRHVASWVQEWDEPIAGSEHGEVGYELRRPGPAAEG